MMAGPKMIAFSDTSGKRIEIDLTGSRNAITAASVRTGMLAGQ